MNLTEDQILTLAPDESSKKAGKDLANFSKWVTKGADDKAIWGECQGSGSKPYQTQIDRVNIAFKCSCPSRKFPCKHGIALGLLFTRQPKLFSDNTQPAWVTAWISKRGEKEEKKAEKTDKEVDEVAQAKRQTAREQKVNDGIEELMTWIKDIVRNGIIALPEKEYSFWNGMAKRMVDAQAPGLAGMIRSLANVGFFSEGWQSRFMDALLNIYLIAKAYQQKEKLEPLVLQDVRNWIGFTVNQEELKVKEGIQDTWLVVGKQITEDENLTVERNWLYGINTNKYALVLQFIIRGQGATVLLSPGQYINAALVYFPSASPLRALIKEYSTATPLMPRQHFSGWNDVASTESTISASFPVRNERAFLVEALLPVSFHDKWWLKDQNEDLVAIKENFAGIWSLLSLSGGHPMPMVVVGKEKSFEPIGVWDHETYKAI